MTNSRAITFRTDDLTLEGVLHEPIGADSFPAVAVCHPHPLYGGDMHNGVVVSVCNALTARGVAALRFNFRGVGRSEGSHGGGAAERDDARAAITYLQASLSTEAHGIGLAGYSFGAAVALSAAAPVRALAAVSPPFAGLDLASIQADIPVLLVAGDRDEFADSARLEKTVEAAGPRVRAVIVPGADHFWWDHLGVVADTVADFFSEKLS